MHEFFVRIFDEKKQANKCVVDYSTVAVLRICHRTGIDHVQFTYYVFT